MASMLDVSEVRMLADADVDELHEFARSPRLHAIDAKGESPLHVAARRGKLALCDLFIQHGANPGVRNFDGRTPAEVAAAEGHTALSQLLMALERADSFLPERPTLSEQGVAYIGEAEDTFSFAAEEEAEAFQYRTSSGEPILERPAPAPTYPITVNDRATDWNLDRTTAPIAGDGINESIAVPTTSGQDGDFLVVRSKGRKSNKSAILPSGTRIRVDADHCQSWASEAIRLRRLHSSDVEALISSCSGNADPYDLRHAIVRILDIAGIEHQDCDHLALWDSPVAVDNDDLSEALESALTRDTPLPGIGRFLMDRSDEEMLIGPMLQIKGRLHRALLGSNDAIRIILRFVSMVLAGELKPALLTLLSVFPDRENDPGSNVLREASGTLRAAINEEAAVEGKKLRIAVHVLDTLELSPVFFKALGSHLEGQPSQRETARAIGDLISELEATTERLILAHLPYVRRFASRNAEDDEDLEDVFQVAFMGLQRSTRRFDPERGHRFINYATYWMRQALTRWRADERAIIRIPIHRHSDLLALDEAVDRLSQSLGCMPTSGELASDLEWPWEQVERLLKVPRVLVDIDDLRAEWSAVPAVQEDFVATIETSKVVAKLLEELPNREVDILRKRFGFDGNEEMTLEEIGKDHEVTRERVRQIEAKALRQLSHPSRVKRLRALLGA